MYGIVNKAIQELVVANFGDEKWEAIRERSGIEEDFFISSEPYDDEITYQLAQAVGEEMNMTLSQVLIVFGEWWVIKTTKERYGGLMESGGSTLKDFLEKALLEPLRLTSITSCSWLINSTKFLPNIPSDPKITTLAIKRG
jgi:hypothetical protein